MIAKMGTEGGTERQKQVLGFVFLENQEGRVCFCLCRCGWRMIHRGQKMCLSRAFLLLCLPGKWDFELGPCWFCQAGGENWQREIQTKGMEGWGNLPGRFQVLFYLLCFPHISSLVNREGKKNYPWANRPPNLPFPDSRHKTLLQKGLLRVQWCVILVRLRKGLV